MRYVFHRRHGGESSLTKCRTMYILVGIKLMSASFSTTDAKFCERFRMAVTVIPSAN